MVYNVYTTYKMVMTGGWCKWHCFNHINWIQLDVIGFAMTITSGFTVLGMIG